MRSIHQTVLKLGSILEGSAAITGRPETVLTQSQSHPQEVRRQNRELAATEPAPPAHDSRRTLPRSLLRCQRWRPTKGRHFPLPQDTFRSARRSRSSPTNLPHRFEAEWKEADLR